LANNLIELVDQYELRRKNITYVKGEVLNLNVLTTTLKSIMRYEFEVWMQVFKALVLASHFLRACQYVIIDEKP
jgi:hypothetical protein